MATAAQVIGFLTGTTCGEACWHAREAVCHCSCGGRNHGCLTDGGVRPERSARIQGHRYILKGVGYEDLDKPAQEFNTAHGERYLYAHTATDRFNAGVPAKLRTATEAQVEKWEELSGFRDNLRSAWCRANPDSCLALWPGLPDLLWIREDLAAEFN